MNGGFHIRCPHRRWKGSYKMHLIYGPTIYILREERGEGVKKHQNYVEITYGSPLMGMKPSMPE